MQLFKQHLRSEFGALLGWAAGLVPLTALITSAFHMMSGDAAAQWQDMIARLPPQMIQFIGGTLTLATVPGMMTALMSGTIPLPVAIWATLTVMGVVTSEWDRGTLEFLLALPVQRWRLLAERWLSFLLQLALLHALIWAAVLVGLRLTGEWFDPGRLAAALLLAALAQAAMAGMVLVLSLFFKDQTRGVLVAIVFTLAMFFLPVFVEAASPVAFLRKLTPFNYGQPGPLLQGGTFPWADVVLLVAWAVAGFALAVFTFARREV